MGYVAYKIIEEKIVFENPKERDEYAERVKGIDKIEKPMEGGEFWNEKTGEWNYYFIVRTHKN